MADLLIQGMHLPKLGHVTTITIYHDGTVADKMGNVETVKAVELPPHGNLKDVDDIVNRLALKPTHDAVSTLLSIQSAIDESPTIVESNVGICSSTERTVE